MLVIEFCIVDSILDILGLLHINRQLIKDCQSAHIVKSIFIEIYC